MFSQVGFTGSVYSQIERLKHISQIVRNGNQTVWKISGKCSAGHIPREISRFCKYFIDYGGKIKAAVVFCQFRRSPLPQDGLEIPPKLSICQVDTLNEVFQKMIDFVNEYYASSEKISAVQEKEDFEL